jgi:hypothetical protein
MILPNVSESWPGARVPLANYELPHVPAHGRGHGFPLGPALEVATQAARALARSGTSLHERPLRHVLHVTVWFNHAGAAGARAVEWAVLGSNQ